MEEADVVDTANLGPEALKPVLAAGIGGNQVHRKPRCCTRAGKDYEGVVVDRQEVRTLAGQQPVRRNPTVDTAATTQYVPELVGP